MGSYSLQIKRSAEKELRSVPAKALRLLVSRIRDLSKNPRPSGCEKLSGQPRFRIRQGDYRVVYEIDDDKQLVTVVKIGHRREVYR